MGIWMVDAEAEWDRPGVMGAGTGVGGDLNLSRVWWGSVGAREWASPICDLLGRRAVRPDKISYL